jgi:cytochrome c556
MTMKRLLLAVSAIVFASIAAQADPIEDREALMKSFGRSMGELAPIAKGEKPFDAAAVQTALATLNENAQKLDVAALFPPGSTNDKSIASPKIWEDTAGFQAAVDKFKADVAAAASAPPADVAALQAAMGTIGDNCGTCHQDFRIKKD